MRRKNGTLFPVALSSKALLDDNGNFLMTRTTIADMTVRHQLEEKLREQAFTDELTGAINRRQFNFLSERVLSQMQRNGKPCVLMALDIDHFKRVNDTYGHAIGDLALKAFVRVCKDCVRSNDLMARMGGEEFVVLLPEAERDTGLVIAERIRAAVQELRVELPDGQTLSFTVSIGVTVITPDHPDLSHALSRADERLYHAKTSGRNRVVAQNE
ncbi:MAG: GGDEF domain-containing protein, partial [Pusillimonas sp.]